MEERNDRTQNVSELRLYTLTELEQIIGVSHRTLMRYVESGRLKAKKICGKWRITEADLKSFINGEEVYGHGEWMRVFGRNYRKDN